MFYLYAAPTSFQQVLHNSQVKFIVFTGKIVGMVWIQKYTNGSYISPSGLVKTSSFLFPILLCISCFFMTDSYGTSTHGFKQNFDFFTLLLHKLTSYSYYLLIIVCLVMARMQKEEILRVFSYAAELHAWLMLHNDGSSKNFRYKLLFKLTFDSVVIMFLSTLSIKEYIKDTTDLTSLTFTITVPVSLLVYCNISTVCYVSQTFAHVLLIKVTKCIQTNTMDMQSSSILYHNILTYSKKMHKTMQTTLMFLMLESLLLFVNQV